MGIQQIFNIKEFYAAIKNHAALYILTWKDNHTIMLSKNEKYTEIQTLTLLFSLDSEIKMHCFSGGEEYVFFDFSTRQLYYLF